MDLQKLARIGDLLNKAGEKELAEYVVSLMLDDSSDEEYVPPKDDPSTKKGKKIRKKFPEGYVSDSEEEVDLSEEEGHAVPEDDLEVNVDAEGFSSLA
jgi:hypothetical protein